MLGSERGAAYGAWKGGGWNDGGSLASGVGWVDGQAVLVEGLVRIELSATFAARESWSGWDWGSYARGRGGDMDAGIVLV